MCSDSTQCEDGYVVYYHGKEFCPIFIRGGQFETVFRSEVMSLSQK